MKKFPKNALRILLYVFAAVMATFSIATAYIVFAPDSWPKPFYLVYEFPPASFVEVKSPDKTESVDEPAQIVPSEPPPSAPLEIRPGQGLMVDTGTKIVNLVDPTGRKYLRVGIVLEFAPTDLKFYTMPVEEKEAFKTEFYEEANAKMPIINDVIITLLASQTFESAYTAEGKEALRKEILNTINQQLPEYRVIFVYFTEFVVQ